MSTYRLVFNSKSPFLFSDFFGNLDCIDRLKEIVRIAPPLFWFASIYPDLGGQRDGRSFVDDDVDYFTVSKLSTLIIDRYQVQVEPRGNGTRNIVTKGALSRSNRTQYLRSDFTPENWQYSIRSGPLVTALRTLTRCRGNQCQLESLHINIVFSSFRVDINTFIGNEKCM